MCVNVCVCIISSWLHGHVPVRVAFCGHKHGWFVTNGHSSEDDVCMG